MIEQSTFDFNRPASQVDDVERVLAWLASHSGFHTAREISKELGLSDRKIRDAAEKADGLIISGPGSPGYCHLYHCEIGTVDHVTSKQISQARKMVHRAIRTKRRAHERISGKK